MCTASTTWTASRSTCSTDRSNTPPEARPRRRDEARADAAGEELLSYAKDGRNTVAESRGIAHKAIARRKAKANRALRHAESRALSAAAPEADPDVFVGRTGRRSWKKRPDAPLGEYVAARLGVRADIGMNDSEKSSDALAQGRKRAKVRSFGLKGSLQRQPSDRWPEHA
jgi:hypothetical protein